MSSPLGYYIRVYQLLSKPTPYWCIILDIVHVLYYVCNMYIYWLLAAFELVNKYMQNNKAIKKEKNCVL